MKSKNSIFFEISEDNGFSFDRNKVEKLKMESNTKARKP